MKNESTASLDCMRAAVRDLATVRRRPCLVISKPEIDGHDLRVVREALTRRPPNEPLDLVLSGPGGSLPTAFKIARDIRRHVSELAAFVPRPVKSAMTMLALAADELVMGDFGEVGPFDSIACDHLCAAFPLERATLERFTTLNEIESRAGQAFGRMLNTITSETGMRPEDAAPIASSFAVNLFAPLLAQIHPTTLGFATRALDNSVKYLERLLMRYRPKLYRVRGPQLIEQLVRGYPDHGFVIDREELQSLGVPVRAPTDEEGPAFRHLEHAVRALDERLMIECIEVPEAEVADCDDVRPPEVDAA